MAAPVNVTTLTGRTLSVTFGEAGSSGLDWRLANSTPNGIQCTGGIIVKSIRFLPSAANDVIRIQQSTDGLSSGGAFLWNYTAAAVAGTHERVFDPPERIFPVIDASSCTFGGSTGVATVYFDIV